MGGLRTLLAVLAVVSVVSVACESDTPKSPAAAPTTVEEFFDALEYGLSRESGLFQVGLEYTQSQSGQDQSWGAVEAWIDVPHDRARWEFRKADGNTADIAAHTASIYTDGALYRLNLEIAGERVGRLVPPDLRSCFPEAPSYVLGLVACGVILDDLSGWTVSVEPSKFEGVETYSLLFIMPAATPSAPDGVPPPPGGWPTPEPVVAAAKQAEIRFHIDASTYLPLAITQSLDSDPDRITGGGLIRFSGKFVKEDALPSGGFSADALGYIPPEEEERRKLENVNLQTPVYWLGRDFDPGGGLPALGELYVESYGPRPPGGDEPNIQVQLAYRAASGGVRLDIYPPGGWEEFTARLGGNFPWTWCSESREFATANATVTIRSAYESFPYQFDGHVVAVRPGETPPTPAPPAIPPLKTDPCPTTAHDRFLAEVRFKDATVVINGTLGYGGQDGSAWGVFDDPVALEAVARGLRLRRAGE